MRRFIFVTGMLNVLFSLNFISFRAIRELYFRVSDSVVGHFVELNFQFVI